ncbi:biotin transporter BioY [Corynebacterium sp. L4756]|uniref:biotin transporter BioY n=1 Tax=unclassified Corynebacterium TaxID=2624378 RepID=UPI00374DD53E
MKKNTATDLAYVAVFTTLIIVLAFVAIPVGTAGVPIVVQNSALILTGLIVGGRRGLYVGLLFLTIGLAFPVLAGGGTTLRALAGPTAGYIIGYVFSPAIAGLIAYRAPRKKITRVLIFIAAAFAALFTQYIFGAIGLMIRSGLGVVEAVAAQLAFIPAASIEMTVVIIIALGVHTAFPDLISQKKKNLEPAPTA